MDVRDLTEEQRRDLYDAVLAYAFRIAKSHDLARDLTQEAFARSMTSRQLDPKTQVSLEWHMYGIVKSLLSIERNAKRRENEGKAAREAIVLSGDAGPSAETISLDDARRKREQALAARRVRELRAELVGQELELSICDLMADGVVRPAELARRTGRSTDEVVAARRRIRRCMTRILGADRGKVRNDDDDEVEDEVEGVT